VRLARYLAHAGVASRRAAEKLIADGRVRVGEDVVTDPARDVDDASGQVPVTGPGLAVSASGEQTLTRLENRGLRVRAGCENGCNITLKMSLSPKTAKRFGFAKRRKTIGRASDSLPSGREVPFDIDLKSKAADALAGAKRAFKVRLDVRATNDTADTARKKIKITP